MTPEEPAIEDVDVTAEDKPTKRAGGMTRVVRVQLGALVWGVLTVASVLLVALLGFFWGWPDRQTNEAAAQSAVETAKKGTVAVYTYSAPTLDSDISSAQSYLTGDFLSEYKQYVESPATGDAKQNAVKTAATVVGSALMELHPGSAEVLLFINQTTTTAQNPATSLASRSLRVTLLKVDGKWLISSMKPA